ncbi:hypothetical protein GUITHDRAFT_138039 [Guillardia theta CCMP2712]|uniref:Tim44-like domain-containing protein n=1 Tax=Guillardia theta (strain CCMP2712) TaxID=905079 RepID=L1JDP4_GUITC|nr:hypothetical protein GUITHDRAFT_138039 [Guillardia theta CCMP2712]EKX46658.1 hypothetical protein GUITHDRAFT_138039 [Guillardia theta CCMP2712]|eukprot:XP_005833638.1 hypothetical protein GUITHDRAFT_138039 [Guillardia theta CCMP2712]
MQRGVRLASCLSRVCISPEVAAFNRVRASSVPKSVKTFSGYSVLANEKKEKEETKEEVPKAGKGFFETFWKSVKDQMQQRESQDPSLKEAQERLEKSRLEALAAAEAAIQRAHKAAEEAKKRADELEQQTRPTRERVGFTIGAGLSAVGGAIGKVAEQPAVQAVGRATLKAAQSVIDAQEKLDKRSQELEQKIYDSRLGKSVREALGEDSRGKGPVEGVPLDKETFGTARAWLGSCRVADGVRKDVAIYQETAWERRVRKLRESAFLGPIMTGEGGRWGHEGVRRERDLDLHGRELGEIKKDDPAFDVKNFIAKLQNETIPFVMSRFLQDQLSELEDILTERSMAVLGTIIKDRLQKGLRVS